MQTLLDPSVLTHPRPTSGRIDLPAMSPLPPEVWHVRPDSVVLRELPSLQQADAAEISERNMLAADAEAPMRGARPAAASLVFSLLAASRKAVHGARLPLAMRALALARPGQAEHLAALTRVAQLPECPNREAYVAHAVSHAIPGSRDEFLARLAGARISESPLRLVHARRAVHIAEPNSFDLVNALSTAAYIDEMPERASYALQACALAHRLSAHVPDKVTDLARNVMRGGG